MVVKEQTLACFCPLQFRTTKRTVRYVEADIPSDDDDNDVKELNMDSNNAFRKVVATTPNKKPRIFRKQETDAKAEDTEEKAVKDDNLPETRKSKVAKKETKKTKKKGRKGKE